MSSGADDSGLTVEDLTKLGKYLGGGVLIATVMGFVGWAAAVSFAAMFNLEGVDPVKIGTTTFYLVGCLSVIGVFLLLAFQP